MVVKKLPGADSVLMVYDLRDRLAATQDGVQRAKSPTEWLFTKYDELDRPILTGTIQSANTRVQMQSAVNAYTGTNLYETRTTSSTHHYYTENSFPNSSFTKTYLTVTYNDDYDIDNDGTANYTYTTDTDFPDNSAFGRIRNKPSVTKVRELDPSSSSEVWFTTANFYDKRYRIIQTKTTGIQGGSNLVTNEINFPGWLVKSKESQTVVQGTSTLTNYVLTRNVYDHQGRLLNTYHKINTGAEKNVSNLAYNELGQLLTKKLHVTSGTGLQKIDFTYNIKGWLRKINEPDLSGSEGDFFGAELLYNEGFASLNGTAMYNGNISGIKWKNGSSGFTQKGYGFIYDQLNRLTTSKYGEGTSYTTNVSRYDENLTYDKNGNIRKLYRNGQISIGVFGNIDSLGYKYTGTGNQVWAIGDIVTDTAGRGDFYDATNGYTNKEYYYDKNGNIWLDRNKKMKTLYNYLNLPSRVSDTITPANKIEYIYTSAGEKLKQRLSTGTTLLYFGNYVYTLDGSANGIAVKYILTQEGRATYSAGAYTYEYFIKDHLGNVRVSFKDSSNVAVIIQKTDYYPFGMMHKPQSLNRSDNRYLYNGKEFQNNLLSGVNLDLYDYGARFYDPQIGRWNSPDLMSEFYHELSPYNYVANDPLSFIDPDGNFRTRFGAWLYKVFHGGEIRQDKGGEWFVGKRVKYTGEGAGIAYERRFDWNGRNQGEDMELEAQKEMYLANESWKKDLDEMGVVYSVTNDIGEARANILQIPAMVIMPNVIKTASAITSTTKTGIKTVDDLIKASGKLTRLKGGAKQGIVKGNIEEIYSNLIKEASQVRGNLYRLKDGTLINLHKSTTKGVSTIDINKAGEIFKIRGN